MQPTPYVESPERVKALQIPTDATDEAIARLEFYGPTAIAMGAKAGWWIVEHADGEVSVERPDEFSRVYQTPLEPDLFAAQVMAQVGPMLQQVLETATANAEAASTDNLAAATTAPDEGAGDTTPAPTSSGDAGEPGASG